MTTRKMTCAELVEVVSDYLEGVLPACSVGSLEDHLEECFGCRVYLEQMRETIELLRSLPSEQLSTDDVARLCDAFRRWNGGNDDR